jgi:hypothetical protein
LGIVMLERVHLQLPLPLAQTSIAALLKS